MSDMELKPTPWNERLDNKVDVQNNIFHMLHEASHLSEKAIFYLSSPTLQAFSGSNVLKKSIT